MGRCATAPKGVLTPALLDGCASTNLLHALVEEWSERTIAEYCGGLSRPEAERLAWQCAGGRSGVCRAYDAGDTMSRHAPHDVRHVQCRGCCVRSFAVIDGPLLPAWSVAPRAGAFWDLGSSAPVAAPDLAACALAGTRVMDGPNVSENGDGVAPRGHSLESPGQGPRLSHCRRSCPGGEE